MYTITFKSNGTTTTESFEKYYELIRFVAMNRIKDEDFISLNMNGEEIVGIDGLCVKAIDSANQMEAFEQMMEAEDEGDSEDLN